MKSRNRSMKLFSQMQRKIFLDRFFHRNNYAFDCGQTKEMIDIKKDFFGYTIINFNVDVSTDYYYVFVMVYNNGRVVTHQMPQFFSDRFSSNQYMKDLEVFIQESTNEVILERCCQSLPKLSHILLHNNDMIWEDI